MVGLHTPIRLPVAPVKGALPAPVGVTVAMVVGEEAEILDDLHVDEQLVYMPIFYTCGFFMVNRHLMGRN
uniref:Uncharacterized protein n=1 Tax=Arundo donax TaxID=35708 RepID=A0A0A9APT5_ARUDO